VSAIHVAGAEWLVAAALSRAERSDSVPTLVTETAQIHRPRQPYLRASVARVVRVHPAVVAVLPLLAVGVVQLLRGDWFVPRFDLAVQELAVQEAAHGQRLLGPYSHFGFFHPGPMLFYGAVPWFAVLGNNGGLAMLVSRVIVDATCIALIIVLIERVAGPTLVWGATVGIAWFELRVGLEWFRDPWNPYAIVLPTALALVAGAALVDGRGTRWRLVVLVVAASYALQSHVGTAPPIALALGCGLFGVLRSCRGRDRRTVLGDAGIAVFAGLACWALPLWDQVTGTGNFHTLSDFFARGAQRPGLDTVTSPVAAALTLPAGHMGNFFGSEPVDVMPDVTTFWWCVVVALLGTAVLWCVYAWRVGRTGASALGALVPVGFATALLAGLQIRGGVSPYLFTPALAVGVLAWAVAGAAVAAVAAWMLGEPRARVVLVGAAIVLTTGAVWVGWITYDPAGRAFGSPLVAASRSGVSEICRAGRPVHLLSSSANWFDSVEVAAAIGECAPDVKLDPGLKYLVGKRRVQYGHEMLVRLETPPVALAPGWRRVWTNEQWSLDLRKPGHGT
jgi:hypothetical protein